MKDETDNLVNPSGSWGQNSKLVLDGIGRLEHRMGQMQAALAAVELRLAQADLKHLKEDVDSLKEFRTQAKTLGAVAWFVWGIIVILVNKFWK
mgnify:CR=1 FL=1